nr:allantoicase [Cryptococcus depauperatus CBS 7841]
MTAKSIPLDYFDPQVKPYYVEVSSDALGSQVVACSDDFFASKDNLIKVSPPISLKGQFGPNGALYDGWESRRHNSTYDWQQLDRVIIRLATPSTSLNYVDIDTSHFNGNEAPQSQVFALTILSQEGVLKWTPGNTGWVEVLPIVDLGPNSRHIFELGALGQQGSWGAIMVRMIPDGGIARFRAYGIPHVPFVPKLLPADWQTAAPTNLLSVLIGGRIISCSDAQFSPPGNLLLPGRGFDMSDGWETRRSQESRGKYGPGGELYKKERKEWVIAKLGVQGIIQYVEVDTAFHPGNYPKECSVEATLASDDQLDDANWVTIVRKSPLGPHRQHYFSLEPTVSPISVFSHIRYNVYPDGGSKRVRIFGHPLDSASMDAVQNVDMAVVDDLVIPALPLTPETFKEYGQVIQGFSLPTSAPKGVHVNIANQGTAFKFHRLAFISESYPQGMLQKGGLHIGSVKAKSKLQAGKGARVKLELLERHRHTTQAFIPMGQEEGSEQGAYVIVAALNGEDDRPDLTTVRAFLATAAQGVNYNKGSWHHSLMTVGADLNYAIVEAQTSMAGEILDCEKVDVSTRIHIEIPPYPFDSQRASPLRKPLSKTNGQANGIFLGSSLSSLLPRASHSLDPIPITPENFKPFGHIITTTPSSNHVDTERAPDGLTVKHNRLAPVVSTYPQDSGAVTGIAVFRATKKVGLERSRVFDVRLMERHPYTSQAFIPMGKAEWSGKGEEALSVGGELLVIVAENGIDDRPDPKTVRSFLLPGHQGLSYAPGVWHHPVLVLDSTLDLACIETQIATGVHDTDERDCELLEWQGDKVFARVLVPK